ncbi:MAG: hypothetical protein U0790_06250 [Isosphaeraceae bacterium]
MSGARRVSRDPAALGDLHGDRSPDRRRVAAIIWVAAILLAIRDRVRPRPLPTATVSLEEAVAASPPMPLWKRILAVPLMIVALPAVLIVMTVLVAPFAVMFFAVDGYDRLRLRLFGIPIPVRGVPAEPDPDGGNG